MDPAEKRVAKYEHSVEASKPRRERLVKLKALRYLTPFVPGARKSATAKVFGNTLKLIYKLKKG